MTYKPFDLTGKVALVTGGNGGIGYGMAEALAQSGADVVIWGSNPGKTEGAVEKLQSSGAGGRVVGMAVDVSDEHAVAEQMAKVVADLGRIDCVIANAGVGGGGGPLAQASTERYRQVLAVNLDGVFFTYREACKHFEERGKAGDPGGSLVVTASLAAIEGAARNQAYAATKGAVISMTKATAVEYARYGVRANSVLPGWIATDMTGGAQGNKAFEEKVIPRVPARRWGQPADFGGVAVYLCSDASSYHSGDTFIIDGAYSIF